MNSCLTEIEGEQTANEHLAEERGQASDKDGEWSEEDRSVFTLPTYWSYHAVIFHVIWVRLSSI